DDATALQMFAQASALARQAGAYRSLLSVAINESHVLGGLGEHERTAQVARAGIASARDYGLARSTGTFLAINVAEPLVALGRWGGAREGRGLARGLPPPGFKWVGRGLLAAAIALCRGSLAGARALIAAARTALGRVSILHQETQYYLPLARLEAEQCLAEGR